MTGSNNLIIKVQTTVFVFVKVFAGNAGYLGGITGTAVQRSIGSDRFIRAAFLCYFTISFFTCTHEKSPFLVQGKKASETGSLTFVTIVVCADFSKLLSEKYMFEGF